MDNIIIDYKKQLNISLFASINVSALQCVTTWITIGSTVQNVVRTTLSDNIPKIIIPTPVINFSRQLSYLKVNNYDNVSAIILINIGDVDITNYNMNIINVLLSPKDILFYNVKDGFFIIDSNGKSKNIQNNVEIISTSVYTSGATNNSLDHYTKLETNSLINTKLDKTIFNTFTGTSTNTNINNKLDKSIFNTYSASTLTNINNRLLKTVFNIFTGTTNINNKLDKSVFNSFTGVTNFIINGIEQDIIHISGITSTKLNKTDFNTFTGTSNTLINNKLSTNTFNIYSASTLTNINNKLDKSVFNSFTGTTLPANYYNKAQINVYTGVTNTNINTRLSTSIFNSYSASTLTNINNRLLKTTFNTYSGVTNSLISTKLDKNIFNSYSGITLTNINSRLLKTDFNIYTGTTNNIYVKAAYGALYESTSGGTVVSVSNAGYTGWITAVSVNHLLTTFTDNATADRITISNGGSGTYHIVAVVSAKYSSAVPIYHMSIFKNDALLTSLQSYVSPANATDRYTFTANSQVSGVVAGDFFDVRFNSNNATPRNITIFDITFNMSRIST